MSAAKTCCCNDFIYFVYWILVSHRFCSISYRRKRSLDFAYWHFSQSMRQGLCNDTVSVRLSVCPILRRRRGVRRVCCCGPRGKAISIDCCTARWLTVHVVEYAFISRTEKAEFLPCSLSVALSSLSPSATQLTSAIQRNSVAPWELVCWLRKHKQTRQIKLSLRLASLLSVFARKSSRHDDTKRVRAHSRQQRSMGIYPNEPKKPLIEVTSG